MLQHILIRIRRRPLEAVAVLLFTAVIALVLCGLHKGNESAQLKYEEIYKTIDVRCTITNLTGDQSDHLILSSDYVSLFAGRDENMNDRFPDDLAKYVEDVQLTGSTKIVFSGEEYTLTGITSRGAKSALWSENGCTIQWNDGLDDAVFTGNRTVCLIPEALAKKLEELELPSDAFPIEIEARYDFQTPYSGELEIGGVYYSEDTTTVYCPWETYTAILWSMGMYANAESLSAVLRDNNDLEEFRELASQWFATPSPNAAGRDEVNGFYLALDINDYQLTQADLTLRNSMRVNELVTLLVFVASALAGFLVGFLVIRSRKREITLMRTLGCSNGNIYAEFALEQLVCILAGVLLGGEYTNWQPMWKLVLFVVINFAGLSAALVVFLNVNLLSTIKDDE